MRGLAPEPQTFLAEGVAELDARLTPRIEAPVAVGFSGGSDSLALLRLVCFWAARKGRRVVALTVDHGLNPKSAEWTAQAGDVARGLGASWRALAWDGPKPRAGVQAAARAARHRLLAGAARDLGAAVLLLGHTADDVRESAVIRADTPGHGHLRPWSPSPVWPEGRGVFLLRPLLASRRRELRDWLVGDGCDWLEDPANADLRYARARARAAIQADPTADPGDLAGRAATAGGLALSFSAACGGGLQAERSALTSAAPDGLRAALSAAAACAGGGERPPPGRALSRLMARLTDRSPFVASVAGARIVADDRTVRFVREAGERARGGLAPLALGDAAGVFDGRFEVKADQPGYRVDALAGRSARLSPQDQARLERIAAEIRPSLPVLLDGEGRPSLPRPFGNGAGAAQALAPARFAAACGLVAREAQIGAAMAPRLQPPYVGR